METINLQRSGEELPYVYETVAVDCYLSSCSDDPEFLIWNGPSILSPFMHPEDIFRYASAMLSYPVDWLEMHLTVVHKYTFEWVAISPFFLPRVECSLGNLRRVRNQIWEVFRTMPDVSHPTESSPPDGRRPNFQAASDGSILTEKNDESERYWTLDVDSVATIERHEHPSDEAGKRVHTSLPCEKLEEQVKHQDQENHRLHKRVSGICESVPTSLISPNLVVHFGTRLWKRNERRRAKEKGTERFSGQAGSGPTGQGLSYIA
ncbi:hypothetical protein CBS76997_10870 [Aspergillus niger]|nr:hypothetical protein CBS13152_10946 [Aspergillus niger]KAI2870130.1 hypothetical protein CBS11852_11128 [Aspergillus niger]KAI3034987.1 hypothetical protein CBS76997_10870 [Aspergillus niger]